MNTAPHILLVEDDPKLRSTVSDYLHMNGFTVTACPDGQSALDSFNSHGDDISLLLLDGMLPDIDGFEVLRKIREDSDIPVIILSARESERDQLAGFRLGADNYITKPFLLSVLKEHINALLSRAGRTSAKETELVKGALKLNTDERKVYLDNKLITTTPREYDVLLLFMQMRKKLNEHSHYIVSVYGVGYKFEVAHEE
ncbi:response regulator transcription factor [Ruminococcus sp.]|uniref:response regulator transcription factor n=1 Tax=Ruminococcus sp. TaxID=41978 RepID=UPI00388F4874